VSGGDGHPAGDARPQCIATLLRRRDRAAPGQQDLQGNATAAIERFVQLRGTRTVPAVETTFTGAQMAISTRARVPLTGRSTTARHCRSAARCAGWERGRPTRLAVRDVRCAPDQRVQTGEWALFYYEFELEKTSACRSASSRSPMRTHPHPQQKLTPVSSRCAEGGARRCDRIPIQPTHSNSDYKPGDYVFNFGLLTLHPDDYARLDDLSQQDLNERLRGCVGKSGGALVVTSGFGRGWRSPRWPVRPAGRVPGAARAPGVVPSPKRV